MALIDALSPQQRPEPKGKATSPELYVRVDHGRWIVDCPVGCVGAEFGNPIDHWFWCTSCFNSGSGYKLLPVRWPENKDEIARLLVFRPLENQNWNPGESAAMLLADNIEHGIGGAP